MEIVRASDEHAARLARLNSHVQKIHSDMQPDVFKDPADLSEMEGFFHHRISETDTFFYIAISSGKDLGYIWFSIERRPESVFTFAQERIYIHHISVLPEYRRQGIGKKLMQAVESVASEQGIDKFALDSWEFNKDAHAFFEKLGFSTFRINMWR